MKTIQLIQYHGRPAALAVGGEAHVADHLTGDDLTIVAAMAHYALQIQAGERPGRYSDVEAEHYARAQAPLRNAGERRRRRDRDALYTQGRRMN